ncbi:MAG: DNRLRE domain-containing protein [Candidatus Heimdallarchaeota archaeon]|nr:MAG: DNRLRE domain-containing protein [Candidatus Heimdallarchaeota archaeon]
MFFSRIKPIRLTLFLLFFVLLTLNASVSYAKQIYLTKEYPTVADTYISSSDPDLNYGDQEYNYLWYSPSETDDDVEYRVLLAFNVSGIPSNATLTDVSLVINWFYLPGPIMVTIFNLTSSFDESNVTWNNSPIFGSKIGSFQITEEDWVTTWNVTWIVKGNGNIYLGLSTSTTTSIYASLWGKESTYGFLPKLEVTFYTEISDKPTSGFLLFITISILFGGIFLKKREDKQ